MVLQVLLNRDVQKGSIVRLPGTASVRQKYLKELTEPL
jgi:hypothetical protein